MVKVTYEVITFQKYHPHTKLYKLLSLVIVVIWSMLFLLVRHKVITLRSFYNLSRFEESMLSLAITSFGSRPPKDGNANTWQQIHQHLLPCQKAKPVYK